MIIIHYCYTAYYMCPRPRAPAIPPHTHTHTHREEPVCRRHGVLPRLGVAAVEVTFSLLSLPIKNRVLEQQQRTDKRSARSTRTTILISK